MACRDFEQWVALYVENDLDSADRLRTAAHLRSCEECAALAEDLKESQAAFKSIRQSVPDELMLMTVRERVLTDVARANWFGRILLNGWGPRVTAGLALLVIGLAHPWFMRAPVEEIPIAVMPVPAAPPPVFEQVPTPASIHAPSSRRRSRVLHEAVAEPPQPLTVKLLTDDPNVIIYWLIDGNGD